MDGAAVLEACAALPAWGELLADAESHGLVPLLARRLLPLGSALPAEAADRLRHGARLAAVRAAAHLAETARVVELLERIGVRSVPWKGPTLAAAAYGDPGLRDSTDIDLLVARAEAVRAVAALKADGYAPWMPVTPRQERALVERHGTLTLVHPARGTTVDLGWSFWHPDFPHRFRPDAFLGRLDALRLEGRAFPALPFEALLLSLAVHGAKHGWSRLLWAADIAGLLRAHPEVDGAALLSEARSFGLRAALLAGLGIADRLFGAALPADLARAVAGDRAVRRRIGAAAGRAIERTGGTDPRADRGLVFRRLSALDRVSDRLAWLGAAVAVSNPNDWTWARLPDPLFPLYPLLRPLRLCVDLLARAGRARPAAE